MSIYMADNPKAVFIDELFKFHAETVDPKSCIVDMFYDSDGRNEWLYITYSTASQKRIPIWGDNFIGITKAFYKFLSDTDMYPWLLAKEQKYVE